ncbi:MAG: RNA polymerase sigma-70 factor [Pedobacter sp.]|nr:RNA polymerase sigma-70 factor [Pedobacter sp.]
MKLDFDNEYELLKRLQSGDQLAFESLYQNYSREIYSKLVKMVKNVTLAEELTQDVFVKVWNKREVITIDQPFRYYLLTLTNNLVNDFYRKAARDRKLQDEIIAASTELYNPTEEQIYYKESKELMDQAIDSLPAQQKLVFQMCKIEGKSYDEVSKLLGISTSTISNHIVKATKSIKTYFFTQKKGFLLVAMYLFQHKH